jgi:hypothetical protein
MPLAGFEFDADGKKRSVHVFEVETSSFNFWCMGWQLEARGHDFTSISHKTAQKPPENQWKIAKEPS